MPRLLVVGDVHGCLHELDALLQQLRYRPAEDHLIFVGDLLNKGPFGAETVHLVRDLQQEGSVTWVRGNHDERYLSFYDHFAKKLRNQEKIPKRLTENWLGPQGPNTIQRLQGLDWATIQNTPISHQEEGLLVVHGGLSPKIHQKHKHLVDSLKWSSKRRAQIKSIMHIRMLRRDGSLPKPGETRQLRPWQDFYDGRFGWVVYGHQPHTAVQQRNQTVGIDTACCYGNRLTALVQEPEGGFYWESVPARKSYAPSGALKRLGPITPLLPWRGLLMPGSAFGLAERERRRTAAH